MMNNQNMNEELPDGFKMTELGPLPEEWRVARFDKCITRVARVPKVKKSQYRNIGLIPIIDQGQSFIAGYTDEIVPYENELPVIVFGDHTRIFKFVDFPFVAGADGTQILVPNRKLFEPIFLYYAFLTFDIPNRGYNRHFNLLREKIVPLPPLPEQRAIAHVLRSVQEAREKTEAVIKAAKELKKSMMKYLFTYGPVPPSEAENVPLKETEIGMMPEEWEVVRLRDIGNIITGNTPSKKVKEYWENGEIDFIKPPDLQNRIISTYSERISKKAIKKARIVKEGSVLVSCIGIIGRVGFASNTIAFNQQINAIEPYNSCVDSWFLFYALQTQQNQIENLRSFTTVPIVSKAKFVDVKIPLPPLPVQQKIASILLAIDEKIQMEENKKKALEELFKTLLHNLMTAKIRVNNLEVDRIS